LFPSIDGVPISRHYRAILRIDLIALDGEDLRRWPIEDRKRKLAKLVRGPHPGIALNGFYRFHPLFRLTERCGNHIRAMGFNRRTLQDPAPQKCRLRTTRSRS
jgi:hypothetical protein